MKQVVQVVALAGLLTLVVGWLAGTAAGAARSPQVFHEKVNVSLPGIDVCDVRRVERNPLARDLQPARSGDAESVAVGSNVWAVSPRRSRDGVAMLANDMHLGLSVPNTWFRMRIRVEARANPGNTIDASTSLRGNAPQNLRIINTGGDGVALDLRVQAGNAPMLVNSNKIVPRLNADRVDGRHANQD